jgi:hypothetical protein
VRAVAAWSAAAIAAFAAVAGFFVLDLVFELAVPQRVVVLLLAAGGIGWAFFRYTRPLLGVNETEIDMALLVERQHRIDSDLVAALQFEQPQAAGWGSRQLSSAVVDFVAARRGINVFAGFSQVQMVRRLGILAFCATSTLIAAVLWPDHIAALANRLLLGSAHYPTQTRIEQVILNGTSVLIRRQHGSTPEDTKCAQGQPLGFLVQCSGRSPAGALVQLAAAGSPNTRTRISLTALTLDERLTRLQEALSRLNEARQQQAPRIMPPWRDQIHSLVRFDAPAAVAPLLAAQTPADLSAVAAAVNAAIERWPEEQLRTTVLAGELGRLNEDLTYKIIAGDAWTDRASVRMIPLPIVELRLAAVPPKYAATAAAVKPDPSGRQIAVVEGSAVEVTAACVNRKPLRAAWLIVQANDTVQQFELRPRDEDRLMWRLAESESPLHNVRSDLQYELQVLDADGLSLQSPIRGSVRIRPDHPPTGLAEVIHKVVLPAAEPVVEYRAGDDYGISRLALLVEVQRGAGPLSPPTTTAAPADTSPVSTAPAQAIPTETHRCTIYDGPQPLTGKELPRSGRYPLALSPFSLAKGDRIKVTLEVTDYRGENDQLQPIGVAFASDSIVLEISDEAGVLAAISQADPNSEERLTEIIKRQLGIGEEPQ